MSEPKLILKAELVEGNSIKVTFANGHPAVLALALQHADLQLKDIIMQHIAPDEPLIETKIPDSIIKQF